VSHSAQIEFVGIAKSLFPAFFERKKVLEIGSLDINGAIRGCFNDCDYIGLDVAPGPGVDVVCEGQKYDIPDASFDVVISCEVMEHNPFWKETVENMIRLLKPGGIMVMSCATTGRPEHGTSRTDVGSSPLTVEKGWEYYRNLSEKDFARAVDFSPFLSFGFATNWNSYDLYFLGIKRGGAVTGETEIERFKSFYKRRNASVWLQRLNRVVRDPTRIVSFLLRKTGRGLLSPKA